MELLYCQDLLVWESQAPQQGLAEVCSGCPSADIPSGLTVWKDFNVKKVENNLIQ